MSTTKELQGINLLTKAQYDAATKSDNQVYAIQGQFVIETYVNGTSWYRVYSDSFLEEGDVLGWTSSTWASGTKTLNKNFNNTNYNLIALGNWSDSGASSVTVTAKTNSNFTVRYAINNSTQLGIYRASGY